MVGIMAAGLHCLEIELLKVGVAQFGSSERVRQLAVTLTSMAEQVQRHEQDMRRSVQQKDAINAGTAVILVRKALKGGSGD